MVEKAGTGMTAEITSEEWKPMVGYEGLYEVSNRGAVRSLDRTRQMLNLGGPYTRVWPGRLLKAHKDKYGYPYIGLTNKAGIRKQIKVHTLVANTFIGQCPADKNQINHIDSNKQNNDQANLEWCNCRENHRHAYKNGTHTLCKYRDPETGRVMSKQNYLIKYG
jgi:hypothetical protein